jgi:hypothetical protein
MNPVSIVAISSNPYHRRRDKEIGPMEGFFVFAILACMIAMLVHMFLMGRKIK